MSKKGGGSPPPAPNPTAMINAQSKANKDAITESAKVNAVNLVGPNGTTTYGLSGDGKPHTQYTNLTPEGQWLFDAQQAIGGQLMQQAYNRTSAIPTSPFSLSGTPHAPQNYNTAGYEMFRPVSLPQGANAMGFQQPMNDPSNFFGGQFGGGGQQGPNPGGYFGAQGNPGLPSTNVYPGPAPLGGQGYVANGGMNDTGRLEPDPAKRAQSQAAFQQMLGVNQSAGGTPGISATTDAPQRGGTGYGGKGGSQQPPGMPGAQSPTAPPEFPNMYARAGEPGNPLHVDMSAHGIARRQEAERVANGGAPQAGRTGPRWSGDRIDPTLTGVEPQMPQFPGAAQGGQAGGYPGGPPGGQPGGGGQQSSSYYPGQPGGDMNVLPYDPRSYGNMSGYVNQVQDAVYDQQMRNLQPSINQQYDRQYQKLKDMGLPVGGEAWNSAVGELNRNTGNQYQQAANQAIAAGGEEAGRRLGMEQGLRSTAWGEALGTHQQQNSDVQQRLQIEQNLRNQMIQEQLMERNQGFNEASAFLQGTPAMGMPQAPQLQQYTMQAPDVIGANLGSFNARMQGYNANQQAAGSAWQGAAGLAQGLGSLATKCSRAFKTDDGEPERILEAVKKLPIRTWRYRPNIDPRQELHIGPYAEDWKRELGLGNGVEINVIDLCGVLLKAVQELSEEVAALKAEKVSFVKEPIMPRPPKLAKKKTKRGAK